jgi:hypothetical protein
MGILSQVFSPKREGRERRAEVRGRRAENGGWRMEDGGWSDAEEGGELVRWGDNLITNYERRIKFKNSELRMFVE